MLLLIRVFGHIALRCVIYTHIHLYMLRVCLPLTVYDFNNVCMCVLHAYMLSGRILNLDVNTCSGSETCQIKSAPDSDQRTARTLRRTTLITV